MARPGDRARNGFIRQLMEMGLVVQKERLRRMDGLSTRISGGFVDEVLGSASAIQRAPTTASESLGTGAPAPVGDGRFSASSAPALSSAEPVLRPDPFPAAQPEQATPVSAQSAAAAPARDDDRPPPRVPGFSGRRMLAGESFE